MPTPNPGLLNRTSEDVTLRATPWWHFTSMRTTSLARDGLVRPRNQNLVVKVKDGGRIKTRARVLVIDLPAHGRLDLVRIGRLFVPSDFYLVLRFISPIFFSSACCVGGGEDRSPLPARPGNSATHGERRLCRPTVSSGDVA